MENSIILVIVFMILIVLSSAVVPLYIYHLVSRRYTGLVKYAVSLICSAFASSVFGWFLFLAFHLLRGANLFDLAAVNQSVLMLWTDVDLQELPLVFIGISFLSVTARALHEWQFHWLIEDLKRRKLY